MAQHGDPDDKTALGSPLTPKTITISCDEGSEGRSLYQAAGVYSHDRNFDEYEDEDEDEDEEEEEDEKEDEYINVGFDYDSEEESPSDDEISRSRVQALFGDVYSDASDGEEDSEASDSDYRNDVDPALAARILPLGEGRRGSLQFILDEKGTFCDEDGNEVQYTDDDVFEDSEEEAAQGEIGGVQSDDTENGSEVEDADCDFKHAEQSRIYLRSPDRRILSSPGKQNVCSSNKF